MGEQKPGWNGNDAEVPLHLRSHWSPTKEQRYTRAFHDAFISSHMSMFWKAIYTYHLDNHVCSINREKVQSGFFLISSPPISFPFLTQLTVITFHFNNHNKTRRILLRGRVNSPPAGADYNNISFEHPSFLDPCLVWEIENTVLEEDHISSILTVIFPLSVSGLVLAMYSILHGNACVLSCLWVYNDNRQKEKNQGRNCCMITPLMTWKDFIFAS